MTTQEILERFALLYDEMEGSKDIAKMRHFGTGFKQMFEEIAYKDPKVAMTTLEYLAAMEYNNYVSVAEAIEEASHFVNDDMIIKGASMPSRGARWSMDTAKAFLTQRGIATEEKPYYNWPALWLTMNMIYSDFADTLAELLNDKEGDKIAVASYKMAVKKLKDLDRQHFIREYFELDE